MLKVYALTADIAPLDIEGNLNQYKRLAEKIDSDGVVVLPSLSFTGFNGKSLFLHRSFVKASLDAIFDFAKTFSYKNNLFIASSAVCINDKLVNAYFFIKSGKIINISLDKRKCPVYNFDIIKNIDEININNNIIKISDSVKFNNKNIVLSYSKNIEKESLVINPSLEKHLLNSSLERIYTAKNLSYKFDSAVLSIGGGFYDSSATCIFNSDKIIAKSGKLLKFSGTFDNENLTGFDIDAAAEKIKPKIIKENLIKDFFLPKNDNECGEIFNILVRGLVTRLKNTNTKYITLGMSGGSDSTLSLMVAAETFKQLKLPADNIIVMTLSGFGTSARTFKNAVNLIRELKVKYFDLDIKNSVRLHLKEISHDIEDVVFENAQARERTQILMDVANKYGGMMIGTSDMSEIALGFSTFGGDHLSMYCTNCNIAKTTVLKMLKYLSGISDNEIIKESLLDVANTPISPELKKDVTSEAIIGSYELNDYFLYKFITEKASPLKIYNDAVKTLTNYKPEEILHWLKNFFKRFFANQFKRNCSPDGVQVFETTLACNSFKMVSDAKGAAFLKELYNIKI